MTGFIRLPSPKTWHIVFINQLILTDCHLLWKASRTSSATLILIIRYHENLKISHVMVISNYFSSHRSSTRTIVTPLLSVWELVVKLKHTYLWIGFTWAKRLHTAIANYTWSSRIDYFYFLRGARVGVIKVTQRSTANTRDSDRIFTDL